MCVFEVAKRGLEPFLDCWSIILYDPLAFGSQARNGLFVTWCVRVSLQVSQRLVLNSFSCQIARKKENNPSQTFIGIILLHKKALENNIPTVLRAGIRKSKIQTWPTTLLLDSHTHIYIYFS